MTVGEVVREERARLRSDIDKDDTIPSWIRDLAYTVPSPGALDRLRSQAFSGKQLEILALRLHIEPCIHRLAETRLNVEKNTFATSNAALWALAVPMDCKIKRRQRILSAIITSGAPDLNEKVFAYHVRDLLQMITFDKKKGWDVRFDRDINSTIRRMADCADLSKAQRQVALHALFTVCNVITELQLDGVRMEMWHVVCKAIGVFSTSDLPHDYIDAAKSIVKQFMLSCSSYSNPDRVRSICRYVLNCIAGSVTFNEKRLYL